MAAVDNIPLELDWVAKRAACTVAQVFNELRTGIENDIATVNATRQLSAEDSFSADLLQNGMGVAIGRPRRVPNKRVLVAISGDSLAVRDEATPAEWSASVALNDQGRCILRLEEGTELEQWQFRMRALQALFFGNERLRR